MSLLAHQYLCFRHIGKSQTSSISRNKLTSTQKSPLIHRKETRGTIRKSLLRLHVDVHVEDGGRISSTLSDKVDDVVQSRSNDENSFDLKAHHSEKPNGAVDNGTTNHGTNTDTIQLSITPSLS